MKKTTKIFIPMLVGVLAYKLIRSCCERAAAEKAEYEEARRDLYRRIGREMPNNG